METVLSHHIWWDIPTFFFTVKIFRRRVTCESDVNVCMHKYASPGKNLEIRCSEIDSEAILEQKQSRSSYMDRGIYCIPIFGCSRMHLLSQLTFNFQEKRY